MLRARRERLEGSNSPPDWLDLPCRFSDARLCGMSCWMPIFNEAGLCVLRTMLGREDLTSDPWEELEDRRETGVTVLLSGGDSDWGIKGSDGVLGMEEEEEEQEEREEVMDIEL